MATRQWYYAISGSQAGPVSEEELIRMFFSGQLQPDTLVWTSNMKDWAKASSIEGLVPPQGFAPPPPPPPPGTGGMPAGAGVWFGEIRYAGFWIRVVASLIDGVVMMIPLFLVSFLCNMVSMPYARHDPYAAVSAGSLLANLATTIMFWLYFAVLQSSAWQASIGKRALGLKVTDLEGNRISFGRATGRYFAGILSGLLFCVGYMMVGWTKKKQGLHDKIADTLVVKQR